MWLPNLEGRKGPVYRAIADAIDADVERGTLRAGTRLPPHRDLADHLGVTVTTVTRAYTEAARRGLTSGHVGRGTFIRGREPEENENGLLDLSINVLMPDKEVANLEVHLMRRRVLPWTQLLGYAPKRGHLRHRQAMAAWLTYLGSPGRPGPHRADRRRTAWAGHDAVGAAQAGRHAARRGSDLFGSAAAVAADALQVARCLDGWRGPEARRARCRVPDDTRERACTACRACRTRRRRS